MNASRSGVDPLPQDRADLVCSARGCDRPAAWDLRWRNPSIHTEDRRKHWLACPDHREQLAAHLSARGFLREVEQLPSGPTE